MTEGRSGYVDRSGSGHTLKYTYIGRISASVRPWTSYPPSETGPTNTAADQEDSKAFSLCSPLESHPDKLQTLKDYRLTIEYKHLKHNAPGGVFVIPSLHQLRLWYGVIFVRRGHYASGVFKFRVELPPDYNDVGTWPVIRFTSTVFNPMVSPTTGVVDLKHAFPEWIPAKQHYMVAALTQVKKIFYMKEFPYPQVPNPEAQALFQNDKRAFLERVENCVRESQEHIYDNEEGSSLRFTEPKPAHDKLRERILGAEREESLSPVRPSKANAQEVPATTTEDTEERDGVGPESESHPGR